MGMLLGVSARKDGHILQIHTPESFLHFDRTGRFVRRIWPGQVIRRGLDGRMLQVKVIRHGTKTYREYLDLGETEKEAALTAAYHEAINVLQFLHPDDPWIDALEHWSSVALADDKQAFQKVYLPISILPPDQYRSLVIQITHGCSYNECLFCDFYRDRKFHIKSMEELQAHIRNIKNFFGERLADRHGIFLADGNALVIPTQRLLSMLDIMKMEFASVAIPFSTFMDTFNLKHKSSEELKTIYRRGLTKVYVGLETGSDRLRDFLQKPGTAAEAATALIRMKEAGFGLGVILLTGVGGRAFADDHLQETLDLLRDIPLTKDDAVFLSPFVEPSNSEYAGKIRSGGLAAFSQEEIDAEVFRWKQHLLGYGPRVTLYPIEEHVY